MKNVLVLFIVASSVSLFADYGNVRPGTQGNTPSQGSQYYSPSPNLRGRYAADQTPQNPSPSAQNDQAFTSQIQRAVMAFFSGKYQEVSITLSKGYVTLTGTVPSQEDKETLEKIFRGIYGVQGVNNQLTIK